MSNKLKNQSEEIDINKLVDSRVDAIIADRISKYFENKKNKDFDKRLKEKLTDVYDLAAEVDNMPGTISGSSLKTICEYFFKKGVEFAQKGNCTMSYDSKKKLLK